MNKLITKLSDDLLHSLRSADEIWIAVALLNSKGLNFVMEHLPEGCIQNYLVGINLPTEPKALWTLFELQFESTQTVNVYTGREYFHPKVYLIRRGKKYNAFIGSANCTNGGLNNNIELTVAIDNQENCKTLKLWFEQLSTHGLQLTKGYIQNYQARYSARQKREWVEEKIADIEKQELIKESKATLRERSDFIKMLKSYRKRIKEYKEVVAERTSTVKKLRSSIDYPTFSDIDIDRLFSIWELGHIISLPKPTINKEIKKFSKLLKMLCDEKIDIAVRYDRALGGDLKIRGINEGLISKLLVAHNPNIYFVKNGKSTKALKKYGIELPRGMSKGNKYKITCTFLRQICKEADIKNLAVLDHYLYLESQNG